MQDGFERIAPIPASTKERVTFCLHKHCKLNQVKDMKYMKSNSKGHWFSSPATRMLLQDLKRCGLEAEGIRSETQNDCREAPVHSFFHILIEWTALATLTTLALFEARAAMLLQASQFMRPKLSIIIQ